MRKAIVFSILLVFAGILTFSSARDEILKTREYVEGRLKSPEKVFDSQEQDGAVKTKCLNPAVIVLFDPEKLLDLMATNSVGNFDNLLMLLLAGRCSWDFGSMRVERDVFDHTDKWKRMFGILISSFEELSMDFSIDLENLRVKNVLLYDFVSDWIEDGGNLRKLGNYLLSFPNDTNHVNRMTLNEGKFSFLLEKEASILEGKPHLWMYLVWVELDVRPETPAGVYAGRFTLSFNESLEE